jgi:oxygen-independent coproporphyrinogen-3 oxidase
MTEKLTIDSLYLHFPYCRHLCNYCDFYKNLNEKDPSYSVFEDTLAQMNDVHNEFLSNNGYQWSELETLYIGGGTPSLWGRSGADYLANLLAKNKVTFKDKYEFTMEVNPGSWSVEGLEQWMSHGVNRFSLGIQSLNPNFIKVLDRVHNIDDVYETLEFFNGRKLNFSVDFMLGLPYSKEYERNIREELNDILKYNPSHLSLYILTVNDHYKHFEKLPDEEWIEREYLEVAKILKEHGYDHYEVSNFAKPGLESIHNLNYWRMKSVAALGQSATGFLSETNIRYKWKVTGPTFVEEHLTEEERRIEDIYMGLRINDGLALSSFAKGFEAIAEAWDQRGLARLSEGRVSLTSKGFLLLDSLMDEIFRFEKDS